MELGYVMRILFVKTLLWKIRLVIKDFFCAGVWTSESPKGAYGSGNTVFKVKYESHKPLVTYNDGYRGSPKKPMSNMFGFAEAQNLFIQRFQERHSIDDARPSILFRKALLEEGYDAIVVHNNPDGDGNTIFHCLLDV